MMEILGIKLVYPTATAIVICTACGISIFSALMHRKMVDRKRMDEIRKRIETHQKEYLEAQKAGDKKKMSKLEQEQAEILGLVKQNMMNSMKPTLFTMPLVLLVIWYLGAQYGAMGPLIDLPFGIPFLTKSVAETGIINGVDWFGLYLVSAITTGLLIELVLRRIMKR
ncbi:MAG: DUF106 domain-containing protein [Candidatus Diapherotrites archaeon]|nr:DUF106 domain-containing protein [Candidatus Diapherotrites archaeon]